MKIFRYFTIMTTGVFDKTELLTSINNTYPELKTEEFKYKKEFNGIYIEKLSTGAIVFDDSVVDFRIDTFIFPEGIITFELSFMADVLPDTVKSTSIFREKLTIRTDDKEVENPLYIHSWKFFFNIFRFAEITPQLSNVNIIDETAQQKIHQMLRDTSCLNTYFLGETSLFETNIHFDESVITCDQDNAPAGAESVSQETDQVLRSGNCFYCNGEDQDFLIDQRILIYRKCLMELFVFIHMKWIAAIKNQAKLIKDNLLETNKVYWNKLKNRLEVWDLNYLDLYTSIIESLYKLENISFPHLSQTFIEEHRGTFEKSRESLFRTMEDTKYSLANLGTPSKAHDEQILQQETEKGNERILLLSFLAMGIPLLGAILAPGITLVTKLISAGILISMPVIYFYIRQLHLRKDERKTTLDYLQNMRATYKQEFEKAKTIIDKIKANSTMNEKTKAESIAFIEQSLQTSEKHLRDIDQEIAKY